MTENNFIGKLNKRIEIQRKTIEKDGFGGFNENWNHLNYVWAEVKPITAFDNFEAEKISEKISHIITIRYLKDIKNDDRIKFYNRIFNIKSILNPFEENKTLKIIAEEIL